MRIAVIPARGGSKRIPRKNIKGFAGKPILAYSIEAAMGCGVFDRVLVSTDDEEIATIAKDYGAEVPFMRPLALADDYTGTTEVVAHALTWLQQGRGSAESEISALCCIYATAPFIRHEDLQRAYALLEQGDWQYVFAATNFDFPIFRCFQQMPGGGVAMYFPEHFNTRSQDLPEALHDAGQFYWGRPQAWLERRRIFDSASTIVLIPRWRVQDIDTPEDWARAEMLWKVLEASEAKK